MSQPSRDEKIVVFNFVKIIRSASMSIRLATFYGQLLAIVVTTFKIRLKIAQLSTQINY